MNAVLSVNKKENEMEKKYLFKGVNASGMTVVVELETGLLFVADWSLFPQARPGDEVLIPDWGVNPIK